MIPSTVRLVSASQDTGSHTNSLTVLDKVYVNILTKLPHLCYCTADVLYKVIVAELCLTGQ